MLNERFACWRQPKTMRSEIGERWPTYQSVLVTGQYVIGPEAVARLLPYDVCLLGQSPGFYNDSLTPNIHE